MSALSKISGDFKYVAIAILSGIVVSWVYFFEGGSSNIYLLGATILGLYMAINIGSNDVANNMGPAVGSKAITISGAIIIAAIFEASGVMIAGGDVVDTVKKGIIDPDLIINSSGGNTEFIAIMMSTLLGAALWVNIATILKAPVSTTHAVIGGLVGAGITSAGLGISIIDWPLFLKILAIIIIIPILVIVGAIRFKKQLNKYLSKKKTKSNLDKWPIYFYILVGVFLLYILNNGFHSAGLLISNHSIVDWVQIGKIAASWVISPVMGGIITVILMLSIRRNILKQEDRGESAKIWVPIYIGIMVWAFSTYLMIKGLKKVLNSGPYEVLLQTEIAVFIGYIFAIIAFIALRLYFRNKSGFFKNSKKFINSLFNLPLIFAVALLSFAHGANDVANAIGPLAAINDAIQNNGVATGKVSIEIWIMILGASGLVLGLSIFGARLIKTVGNEITKLNQIRAYCVALGAAITVIIASQLGLPVSSTHIALGGVFGIGLMREYIKRQKGDDKDYVAKNMIRNIAAAWVITLPAAGIVSSITYLVIMKLS